MNKLPILFLLITGLTACSGNLATEGLTIGGSGVAHGQKVDFEVENASAESADIVLIASQDGDEICSFLMYMKANSRQLIHTTCDGVRAGEVDVSGGWAAHLEEEASSAERIGFPFLMSPR